MLLILVGLWFLHCIITPPHPPCIVLSLISLHNHPILSPLPLLFWPELQSSAQITNSWERKLNQSAINASGINHYLKTCKWFWLPYCWYICIVMCNYEKFCRITVIYMQIVCYDLNITFGLKNCDSAGFRLKHFFGFGSDFVSKSQHSN